MAEMSDGAEGDESIGKRIRALRKRRNLTLVQMNERSGVSRAALSKIERGEISPSYATLRKIGFGLEVTIAELVSAEKKEPPIDFEIVRRAKAGPFNSDRDDYRFLAGTSADQAPRCVIRQVRSPFSKSPDSKNSHSTLEVIFVLSGDIVCHLEGHSPIQLNKGDSLFYKGSIPHAFTCIEGFGEEPESAKDFPAALCISTKVK